MGIRDYLRKRKRKKETIKEGKKIKKAADKFAKNKKIKEQALKEQKERQRIKGEKKLAKELKEKGLSQVEVQDAIKDIRKAERKWKKKKEKDIKAMTDFIHKVKGYDKVRAREKARAIREKAEREELRIPDAMYEEEVYITVTKGEGESWENKKPWPEKMDVDTELKTGIRRPLEMRKREWKKKVK